MQSVESQIVRDLGFRQNATFMQHVSYALIELGERSRGVPPAVTRHVLTEIAILCTFESSMDIPPPMIDILVNKFVRSSRTSIMKKKYSLVKQATTIFNKTVEIMKDITSKRLNSRIAQFVLGYINFVQNGGKLMIADSRTAKAFLRCERDELDAFITSMKLDPSLPSMDLVSDYDMMESAINRCSPEMFMSGIIDLMDNKNATAAAVSQGCGTLPKFDGLELWTARRIRKEKPASPRDLLKRAASIPALPHQEVLDWTSGDPSESHEM